VREPDVFILAIESLNKVVAQIKDEQWEMTLPESFKSHRDTEPVKLHRLINYHAYDIAWVPDTLSGKTMDEVGRDKFDGDLLANDPKSSFGDIVDKARTAAKQVTDEQLDTVAHLSFGDYKVREYFWQINMFHGLRARDIAKVIGVDPSLPDDLVQGIWDEVSPNAEEWRKLGVFGPEIKVDDDAHLLERLLGLTGRA
jgi:hypothetical protein